MNYKFAPLTEYKMLEDWYANGSSDVMPEELQRLEAIYREAWKHLKRGHIPYSRIAKVLVGKFPEYNITYRTGYHHVRNAAAYYGDSQLETKDLHRRRITESLYKQVHLLQETVAKHKPLEAAKEIRGIYAEIAKLNGVYEPELPEDLDSREIIFLLHDNAKALPNVPAISEKKLIGEIEYLSNKFELDEKEKAKLIEEDVQGGLPARE